MNIAIIIAGGRGQRMHQDVPKQFLNVNDKPVIIYTLEAFERHPGIDEIGVVCLDGWDNILLAYARQYHITKLKWIVPSGQTGQMSIYNGIQEASKRYQSSDIILVHDAVRPMVSQDIISDCIITCQEYGSAISVGDVNTVILKKAEDAPDSSKQVIIREELAQTQTPQALPLKTFVWAHEEAQKRGITNSVATCTLMIELGQSVHFSSGNETNIKLTTQGDMRLFKALLSLEEKE